MARFFVPDMSCGHCTAAVSAALSSLPDTGEVTVTLQSREVEVTGAVASAAVLAALDAAGYPARIAD